MLGRAGRIAAVVAALLASGTAAQAAPLLSSPVVVAQPGESVICFASNVSTTSHDVTITITNAASLNVASQAKTIDSMKTAAVSWAHPGNFPGFYICQVDLKGFPRRHLTLATSPAARAS